MAACARLTALLACFASMIGCGPAEQPELGQDPTGSDERGWIVLFDGESFDGWRGFGTEGIPDGWAIDEHDRAIHFTHADGDINLGLITDERFADFELRFDWKVAPAGNSGVFFRVSQEEDAIWKTGPEYQIVDNDGHPDGEDPLTAAGSNYALHGPERDHTRPAGQYNDGRLVVRGAHVEQWLNGEKIVEYELWSEDWERRIEGTAFADWPAYGRVERGHISLQEGGPVWYRNIRLRRLE